MAPPPVRPRTKARGALLAMVALLLLAAPDAAVGQAAPADRLQVLFLGDDRLHRPFQRSMEILPVLAANGIDMFYTDDPAQLNPERLSRYHALILFNNQPAIQPAQLQALLGFVERGGGLVAVHSASASFQNSEEFIKLIGGAFLSHGDDTFSAVRVAGDHPALLDVPVFESWDETYVHAKHNPVNRTVLEVRREGDHDEPWTWVRTYGNGRVFYTAWGHDERTWSNEGFQKLLVQGTRWAAGDWAIRRISADESLPTTTLSVPLPVYEREAPWNTLAQQHITEIQAALPVERSLDLTTLRPGFSIDWFATEPMVRRIIDFTWDERGRMWAVETNDYPNRLLPDDEPGGDRILILEDTNQDGRADRVTVFADGLNLATSIVLVNGGAIVAQAPHIFFLKDTTGDDRADVKELVMTGFPRNDTHGTPSNFRYGLDNQILAAIGYNGFTGTVGGRTYSRQEFNSGYFRFQPDGSTIDYLARTNNNTWGVAQSEDGFTFGSTANGRPSTFVHIPVRYYESVGIGRTPALPVLPGIEDRATIYPVYGAIRQVDWFDAYTAGSAHELYTARAFPKEYWNRAAFVAEPTGHLIGMFDLRRTGSTFAAQNLRSFLASRDTWVAPVQVKVGPDGALWVSDFYTLVAQHNPTPRTLTENCCETGPGNAYDTPNRDAERGRIYRISHEDAPAYTPVRLDGATPAQLIETLRNDNMFWRLTAQRLLVERGQTDVVPGLVQLLSDHTIDELGLNTAALHALWTLDGLGAIETDATARRAVRDALYHPAPSLRRAALMVLPRDPQLAEDLFTAGMLPDRGSPWEARPNVGSLVRQDADLGVRMEATLVLSELPGSARSAAAIAELLATPQNLRDPWMPDALGIAGAKQGLTFLQEQVARGVPQDSAAVAGVGRAVQIMAYYHASHVDVPTVLALVEMVPTADSPVVARGVLEGIAQGWPEETPPTLTAAQRERLAIIALGAPDLEASFTRVADRWALPDAFRAP